MNAEATKDRVAPRPVSVTAVLACAWPALLLATFCLFPYLNKAFLVDDPHFLAMAQQIIKHPMHPMDFDICWNTIEPCTKAYVLTPGNALMGYVLVPTVLGGEHEWMAHLTQLVLAWIAIVAMTSLIFRLRMESVARDDWRSLLLVAIPPFLPMASTAIPDLLAAAVALVAMERLAAWKAEQKWSQGAVAAIALGLAGFARSHLALLLPLAALFLLDSIESQRDSATVPPKILALDPGYRRLRITVDDHPHSSRAQSGNHSPSCSRGQPAYIRQPRCLPALPGVSATTRGLLAG